MIIPKCFNQRLLHLFDEVTTDDEQLDTFANSNHSFLIRTMKYSKKICHRVIINMKKLLLETKNLRNQKKNLIVLFYTLKS